MISVFYRFFFKDTVEMIIPRMWETFLINIKMLRNGWASFQKDFRVFFSKSRNEITSIIYTTFRNSGILKSVEIEIKRSLCLKIYIIYDSKIKPTRNGISRCPAWGSKRAKILQSVNLQWRKNIINQWQRKPKRPFGFKTLFSMQKYQKLSKKGVHLWKLYRKKVA